MSRMDDLVYDIEQLYIEGCSPASIAFQLDCPVEWVYQWLAQTGVAETPQEDISPFQTINS